MIGQIITFYRKYLQKQDIFQTWCGYFMFCNYLHLIHVLGLWVLTETEVWGFEKETKRFERMYPASFVRFNKYRSSLKSVAFKRSCIVFTVGTLKYSIYAHKQPNLVSLRVLFSNNLHRRYNKSGFVALILLEGGARHGVPRPPAMAGHRNNRCCCFVLDSE